PGGAREPSVGAVDSDPQRRGMTATHSLGATAEMAVPFVRLDRDDPALLEELLAEVRDVATESAFTLGDRVEAFERDFAAYCEAGATVGMDPLLEVARAARIAVVEDACQAHGARYRGRRVGALGDIGSFSFYPAKNLGAWGDGGAVVTNRPELADRVRLLRSHGER